MNFADLLLPLDYFLDASQRVYLLYLGTSLFIAVLIHLYDNRKQYRWFFGYEGATPHTASPGPIREIFPRSVYLHPSAVTDYFFFVCNVFLYAVILVPFQFFGTYFSQVLYDFFSEFAAPMVTAGALSLPQGVLFGLVLTLVADFGTFLAHLFAHQIPWLWEFHKVHHSAGVLTPLTVYRMHPVDDVFTLIVGGALVGSVDALLRFFFTPSVPPILLFGLNAVTFLFYLTGYHLRHSHVWLSYGPTMSRILISPAQHQIHHSVARPHWNKNYGFVFALWDWMFGTLYVPTKRETITFGIGKGEEREYSSVLRLYFLPFIKCWRLLRKPRP